jgi:putative DNA methylase
VPPGSRAWRVEEAVQKRKLIEVALPLETINKESAREKSIRHGHPSTLHLWWARRPLAAARAVLFAQLVDDPSALPEEFPTEELQRKERERLHSIIERLVVWENVRDEKLLAEAHAEILKSTGGKPPVILDPFAGGGTIPLEAQRLGLESHASDLNPVAVLIDKALIEIPPRFRNQLPIFPGSAESQIRTWKGAEGLAADVRSYGAWMRTEAEERIGHMYPKADGRTVIAWIWARTVNCPNPACGIEMPLVRSWWLGKKKGKEAYVVPSVEHDVEHPSGQRVTFTIGHDVASAPTTGSDGTVKRNDAICVACEGVVSKDYIKSEGFAGRLGATLIAIVAEGKRKREYLAPTTSAVDAARVERPDDVPDAVLSTNSQYMGAPLYGLVTLADLFTNRQLVALTTLSDLAIDVHARVTQDGGTPEYADAVVTYLGLAVSRGADRQSALCSWDSSPSKEQVRGVFARQAMSMTWDIAEANPFASSSGTWSESVEWVAKVLDFLPANGVGVVEQVSATSANMAGVVLSTDPPYYDNVPYADLSDFFYGWLRRTLRGVRPDLLGTITVPKADELVANPVRQGGKGGARRFFEDGFRQVFARARQLASSDFPITVYYAFKQSEGDDSGEASTGWETLLEGMITAGWMITATWPNRSELANRMRSVGSNALASSIVLSLRPRPDDAPSTDRRGFISALEAELPDALRRLQQGQIAPVDLPQAAIGPGMSVFSRYSAVIESGGTRMTVRSALARINEILDQVLNEQEGDFDSATRFAIAWYRQHGYDVGAFGDANNLANARNTTVDVMDRDGILSSRGGKVQLIAPADLSWDYNVATDLHTSNWEALHHLIKVLERDGIAPAGAFLQAALGRPDGAVDSDLVKELGHLLFRVAEGNGWTKDALSFNAVVTSWPEIMQVARTAKVIASQGAFEFNKDD